MSYYSKSIPKNGFECFLVIKLKFYFIKRVASFCYENIKSSKICQNFNLQLWCTWYCVRHFIYHLKAFFNKPKILNTRKSDIGLIDGVAQAILCSVRLHPLAKQYMRDITLRQTKDYNVTKTSFQLKDRVGRVASKGKVIYNDSSNIRMNISLGFIHEQYYSLHQNIIFSWNGVVIKNEITGIKLFEKTLVYC